MGLRGPTRSPDSRRGAREAETSPVTVIQQSLEAPAWLTPVEKVSFAALVDEAKSAGLSVLRVDAHAYAMVTRLRLCAQAEVDGNAVARIMRTLLPWEMAVGLNAMARVRLGIKQQIKKTSMTARLLDIQRDARK